MKERKQDHLRICIEKSVEVGDAGFDSLRLAHRACPELDLKELDTSQSVLGKRLAFPLIFEAITGGAQEAEKINKSLARVAQEFGLGMGVGSQRAAIENGALAGTYAVRDVAPDILLIGNLGAVQLNYGYGADECRKAVDMIGADALALHLNPLQEAIQPEGNTDFRGLIGKINKVAGELDVPVVVKEVGCGIDPATAKRLKVAAFDVGGWGGTSWSMVESFRNDGIMGDVGRTFANWGIPTADCLVSLSKLGTPLIASGGIRSGLDAAKAVALGADAVGVALPALKAYHDGGENAVREYVLRFMAEFRTAMYLSGSKKVRQLRGRVV
jgi:isopentenyl-diphosphate Delta-isomerase